MHSAPDDPFASGHATSDVTTPQRNLYDRGDHAARSHGTQVRPEDQPERAGRMAAEGQSTTASRDGQPAFVGTVWIATDAATPPGTPRIFLPDGTMVMDSCGETYRLARWESIDRDRITWQEDGARIEAAIAQATPDALHLRLRLRNEVRQENYRPAHVPYVCADSRPNPETSIRP